MNKSIYSILAILSAFILAACSPVKKEESLAQADMVLTNGKIYTMDSERTWASSVAISNGVIVAVGSDEELSQYIGSATNVVDLKNKMVLPSFQDVHVHPMSGGFAYTSCALFELETLEEVLSKISECVKNNPNSEYIQGSGWDWGAFIGEASPDKRLLDKIDSTRSLIFGDADGHTLWLNSAALAFAGINRDTVDPEGGEIGRDALTGELNGWLREGPAMALIEQRMPAHTLAEQEAALIYAQRYLNGLGVTAIQDANVGVSDSGANNSLPAYKSLQDKGELNLRVVAAMFWEPEGGLAQIDDMIRARKTYSHDRLHVSSIKFWADGILETHTAKLLLPYSDKTDASGLLMIPESEIMAAVPLLDAENFQVHIHAIGDATVRYALDAFEKAREINGVRDSRHLTAHTQLVNPDDVGRFAELGAIATFSPYWAYYDEYVKTINPPQIGEVRMNQMYPMRDIIDSGAKIAFGSDWSVSTASPLLGIETAVSRKDPHITTDLVFIPEQRITLDEAIAGYTINAAFVNFLDKKTGSIEVGKYADLVVLSENLFDIKVEDISAVEVTATLLEGKLIFGELSQ